MKERGKGAQVVAPLQHGYQTTGGVPVGQLPDDPGAFDEGLRRNQQSAQRIGPMRVEAGGDEYEIGLEASGGRDQFDA